MTKKQIKITQTEAYLFFGARVHKVHSVLPVDNWQNTMTFEEVSVHTGSETWWVSISNNTSGGLPTRGVTRSTTLREVTGTFVVLPEHAVSQQGLPKLTGVRTYFKEFAFLPPYHDQRPSALPWAISSMPSLQLSPWSAIFLPSPRPWHCDTFTQMTHHQHPLLLLHSLVGNSDLGFWFLRAGIGSEIRIFLEFRVFSWKKWKVSQNGSFWKIRSFVPIWNSGNFPAITHKGISTA